MRVVLRLLRALNYIFGGVVIVVGVGVYVLYGALVPLLLAIALAVVGPVEDLLQRYLRVPGVAPEQTRDLVDQGTSLTFIILLLVAIALSL